MEYRPRRTPTARLAASGCAANAAAGFVLAVLIAVVFTLATLIGLWVLNQAPADPGVIFSGAGKAVVLGGVAAGPG